MGSWRIAWRNIFRNPRRTVIVVAAVAIGVGGAVLTMATNYGMIFQMVENAIDRDLGHVQVHAAGWASRLDGSIDVTEIGRLFLRNIAMQFDAYLPSPKAVRVDSAPDSGQRFSQTV